MTTHVLAIAESDSYLKWAAALLDRLPAGGRHEVVVPCSPARPSADQRLHALSGTGFAGHQPDVLTPKQILDRVTRDRPDAVLLAATGPTAHAVQEALSHGPHRPVLLAGIPGIALPARKRAWDYRGAVDLMVVHSKREVEEYERVRLVTGKSGRVGLATLPFLPERVPVGAGTKVLFATQGKVPKLRREREDILRSLARLAVNRPELDVVVKTRGVVGEFHTHHEAYHYQSLWDDLVRRGEVHSPTAVTFAAGSMAEQLREAAALVTVSSTAALEAMALDVPVLLIDEFGVSEALINQVFVGSGCLAGLAALEQGEFHRPASWWLDDNYFHPSSDDTWVRDLEELVANVRDLPPLAAGLNPHRSRRRRRRDRLRLTPAGSALVRARQRLKQRVRDLRAASGPSASRSPLFTSITS